MKELSPAEEKTLRAIVLQFGEEPFTAEGVEKAVPGGITGYEVELGIEKLRERGIVVTRKKAWGERIHTLAPKLFADWQKVFIIGDLESCAVPEEGVERLYEPKKGFPDLLFFLLAFAANDGLTLTQKGMFHKKDMMRLQGRFDVTDDDLSGLDIAYMNQDKVGKPLAVVYDAALRLGLMRHGPAKAEIVSKRLEAWLSLTKAEMEERLLDVWMDVYTPKDVWLQHVGACLRTLPNRQWISIGRLLRRLKGAGVPVGEEAAVLEICSSYWIRPMAAFGWLDIGTLSGDGEEEMVIRRTSPPADDNEERRWYVQPNFEVFVPPNVPYTAKWELEAFADYLGGDTVEGYVITRPSWERSLASGKTSSHLIQTLREHAAYGVPELVEATLRGWSEQYGAVTIEEATLLRCRNAKDAEFLRGDDSAAPFLLSEVGELDFIVPKEQVKHLMEVLRRQGFSPRLIQERQSWSEAGEGNAEGSAGIVYAKRSLNLYPIDPAPPGTELLRERLERVPGAWLRSFRKYHASTVKQLVEAAIDVRTSVKLKVEGEEVDLVPIRVEPSGPDWIVRGFVNGKETEVRSDRCGEAQLIIPEHN